MCFFLVIIGSADKMDKLSKDSLNRPRFIANKDDITKENDMIQIPGSDGIITPDKILQDLTKKSKETDSRGKFVFSSKRKDLLGMDDDALPDDYQDDIDGGDEAPLVNLS